LALHHSVALRQGHIYDSYVESLERINTRRAEVNAEFRGSAYRELGRISIETVMAMDFPLLAAGLDRDGLLAGPHSIAQLGLAKVDTDTGVVIPGTFLWPVAQGYSRTFESVDESFDYRQVQLILDKATELQQTHLYIRID
jgi:hypothetical protein